MDLENSKLGTVKVGESELEVQLLYARKPVLGVIHVVIGTFRYRSREPQVQGQF